MILTREDEPGMLVGNEMMTLGQARRYGEAILSVVDVVEAATR